MTRYATGGDFSLACDMQIFNFEVFHHLKEKTARRLIFLDDDHPALRYVVYGGGFRFDPHTGEAIAGTIHRIEIQGDFQYQVVEASYDDLSLALTEFGGYVNARDTDGLLHRLFSGNDEISGSHKNDYFRLDDGGRDTVRGNIGDDVFDFGGAFDAHDRVEGGGGNDILLLSGDYSAGVRIADGAITGIARIELGGGNSYKFTLDDAKVGYGQSLKIDGASLQSSDRLTLHGEQLGFGSFDVVAGRGNDAISGGMLDDSFDLSLGGDDRLDGGGGNDMIRLGGALNRRDRIDGGDGFDTVFLDGDYARGLVVGDAMLAGVDRLKLAAGHSYKIILDTDALVPAGTLSGVRIDGADLSANDGLVFDGRGETDGTLTIIGGAGDDWLIGGGGGNIFLLDSGGKDRAEGGGGVDFFDFGASFTGADRVQGGAGEDSIDLGGAYQDVIRLTAAKIQGIENLTLERGHGYRIQIDDLIPAGQTLTVHAGDLRAGESLVFRGDAETAGHLYLIGGAGRDNIVAGAGDDTIVGNDGNDVIVAGAGNDIIEAGLGADHVTGGAGEDRFFFSTAAASNHYNFDTIGDFDFDHDKIGLPFQIQGIDADRYAATLADFETEFDAAHLGVHHVALGHIDGSSDVFAVVDMNGQAGYQIGADLLVDLGPAPGTPDLAAFVYTIYLQAM